MKYSNKISESEQLMFAEISGDYNPFHVDKLLARRYLFGQRVVHGMHLVMRTIDIILSGFSGKTRISKLESRFIKPVFIDFEFSISIVSETPYKFMAQGFKEKKMLFEINVEVISRKNEYEADQADENKLTISHGEAPRCLDCFEWLGGQRSEHGALHASAQIQADQKKRGW